MEPLSVRIGPVRANIGTLVLHFRIMVLSSQLDARNIPNKQFYILFYRLELCYILTIPSHQESGTSKANIGT